MPETQSTLSSCLRKARELRITNGFGLFILTKAPDIHDYRLVNVAVASELHLWLQKETHKFACFIDELDILLIDSTLPWAKLHSLFGQCEHLDKHQRTAIELTDFIDVLKEQENATPSTIPN